MALKERKKKFSRRQKEKRRFIAELEEIGELWGPEVMQLVGQSQKVLEEQAAKKERASSVNRAVDANMKLMMGSPKRSASFMTRKAFR